MKFDLDQQLCLFARDEVTQWFQMRGKALAFDISFRKHVAANIDSMVARAELMACKIEREQVCYTERWFGAWLISNDTGGQQSSQSWRQASCSDRDEPHLSSNKSCPFEPYGRDVSSLVLDFSFYVLNSLLYYYSGSIYVITNAKVLFPLPILCRQ